MDGSLFYQALIMDKTDIPVFCYYKQYCNEHPHLGGGRPIVVKSLVTGVRTPGVEFSLHCLLPLLTLDRLCNHSLPWFPYLQNGNDNTRPYIVGLLWELNELMYVKLLEPCLSTLILVSVCVCVCVALHICMIISIRFLKVDLLSLLKA